MNRPVSVGLIGLGAVVRHIHMPAYARLGKQVRVIAGCDPDRAAREHARGTWGLRVFATPQDMLEAVRPDVIAVCTPPRLHRDHVLLALEHGCHVFCEKPLAEDLRQADEMAEVGRRTGRLIVVNSQYPFMNIHAAAKRLIGAPQFGRLLHLQVWHAMRATEQTEAGWRGDLSRRLCFEFGTHVFELVRFFFENNPDKVLAHMPNPLGRSQSDAVNVIPLEFADATSRLFAGFLKAIGDGSEPPSSIGDNRETLALVMAAYESAKSGKWVSMRRHPRPVAVAEGR